MEEGWKGPITQDMAVLLFVQEFRISEGYHWNHHSPRWGLGGKTSAYRQERFQVKLRVKLTGDIQNQEIKLSIKQSIQEQRPDGSYRRQLESISNLTLQKLGRVGGLEGRKES